MATLEQSLFFCREVDVFRIPARQGAAGHRSGEWRVANRLATCRLKVVARGEAMEVRLEDASTGELFGVCPVPRGQSQVVVEQASDSSRNFVLRLEDAETKRRAFVGISFSERTQAFDFNVALSDHERQVRREQEMGQISSAADPLAAAESILPEAASLYKHQDLSLKQGEKIKIEVKKKSSADSDSFLSRLGASSSGASGGLPKLAPLAPPPGDHAAAAPRGVLPPPPAAAAAAPRPSSSTTTADLLGLDVAPVTAAVAGFQPFAGAPPVASQPPAPLPSEEPPSDWATF
eukprot:scaffold13.g360.t1